MTWLDWLIVFFPLASVYALGWYSRRYIRGVSDFLVAGRLCGRYLINVGDLANALSIIGLTAYVEVVYKTGFALGYWNILVNQVWVIIGLTGFCNYRFRETQAMSIGQFFEMRYNRSFRVFASTLRTISEILANMIMPALAARFFIYFLDLPKQFSIAGIQISTFMLIIALTLIMAISIICMGGTLALIITDTFQGLLCYLLLVIFVIFILCHFSWSNEILPVMSDRVAGESFINPFDISHLQDFNVFSMIFMTVFCALVHRISWISAGSNNAARSPHEQKMSILLGAWRNSLMIIFYMLIAVTIITLLNSVDFANEAHTIRTDLVERVVHEMVPDKQVQSEVLADTRRMPVQSHIIGKDAPLSQKENLDTRYLNVVHSSLKKHLSQTDGNDGQANELFQKCRTLYYQLTMAISMRHLLPVGMAGLFCLLMLLAMISTDDSRIYSSAVTIAQDIILPFRKAPLSSKQHVNLLRCSSIGVGVVFFLGSSCMSQMDYINMYVTLVCTMWLGGCGPVMLFGLYGRFGSSAGAWASLLGGMIMAILGVFLQHKWAIFLYPWLERHHLVEKCDVFLRTCSKPFEPWIVWRMDAVKFPINSYEFYFITMIVGFALYIGVSFLTQKEPFNIERMLHRGKYALDGERNIKLKWSLKSVFANLVGITPEYSRGDRAIAYGVAFYSFIYSFVGCFGITCLWNLLTPWPLQWWGHYFLIVHLIVPSIISALTTVWYGIGSVVDMKQLFKDLKARVANPLDDGRVEGNMSLADKAELEAVDKKQRNK